MAHRIGGTADELAHGRDRFFYCIVVIGGFGRVIVEINRVVWAGIGIREACEHGG